MVMDPVALLEAHIHVTERFMWAEQCANQQMAFLDLVEYFESLEETFRKEGSIEIAEIFSISAHFAGKECVEALRAAG